MNKNTHKKSKTDGKTVVTILGSGTCVPSLRRSSCSVLVEMNGTKLLFDSGAGTIRRLLEANVTIFDISIIFYSHLHPDHTGELVPFLFSLKYGNEGKLQTTPTIVAAKGFAAFFDGLKKVYGHWIEAENGFNIIELDNNSKDLYGFDNFTVESVPVAHTAESIAYRINDRHGASIVYSGDTDYTENLIDLSKDADLLICESAVPDALKVSGHLSPSLAGKIAERANVRQLVLTHFYPACDTVDIEKECRKTYSGRLTLAEDLMRIDL